MKKIPAEIGLGKDSAIDELAMQSTQNSLQKTWGAVNKINKQEKLNIKPYWETPKFAVFKTEKWDFFIFNRNEVFLDKLK